MRKFTTLASALVLAMSLPALSEAQGQGQGKGQGQGRGNAEAQGPDRNEARGREARPDNRGNGNGNGNRREARGQGQERGQGQGQGRGQGHGQGRDHDRGRVADRGPERNLERAGEAVERRDRQDRRMQRADERRGPPVSRGEPVRSDRTVRRVEVGEIVRLQPRSERGLIQGCPPGLARRNNGCLPPGQERQMQRARYDALWSRPDDRYRYHDGYLYRLTPQGGLAGYLPVLGGVLATGNMWPQQYQAAPLPSYYVDYFGLRDPLDYRYADGVVYGVDPQTQAIRQVAALLTGDQWAIGQPAPVGYDVYNVPYPYRDQYVDTPDSRYRYSDGYVYQIDPTTQLVAAAIQLLT